MRTLAVACRGQLMGFGGAAFTEAPLFKHHQAPLVSCIWDSRSAPLDSVPTGPECGACRSFFRFLGHPVSWPGTLSAALV
jgi:hypothetical protein